jgi:hypothetical protein
MGFRDAATMLDEVEIIRQSLRTTSSLSGLDWTRALLALEVVFVSDVVGAAGDWRLVTGWTDEQTVKILRGLQHKLRLVRAPLPPKPQVS